MINSALYIVIYVLEIVLLFGVTVYTLALLYSALRGSPYVATKKKLLEPILKEMGLKKGQKFLELGCGDGRILRMAALHYGVSGLGIDINPIIIWWARWKTLKHPRLNIRFETADLFKTPLRGYDVIYLFLMPELLKKLGPKLESEAKKGTLIVSHGFTIDGWKKYCFRTLEMKPFSTYFYRIPAKK